MAGYVYRPMRELHLDTILTVARHALKHRDRIGLVSAAVSDHSWIDQIAINLRKMGARLSASSMRVDPISEPLVRGLAESGNQTLTVAPEAGSVRLRKVIKARDRDAVLSIELVSDCYAGWVDVVHSEGVGFHVAPESFGEMYRYTFPAHVITNRPIGSPESDRRKQLGKAFSLGLRFDSGLRDVQNHARYMARLVEIYKTHADLLLEGRFVDNEGFLCDNNRVSSHAFVAGNRMAVTLWNPTDVAQRARVVATGYQLEKAEWQDPSWSGPDRWILPGDVAVLIFRRM